MLTPPLQGISALPHFAQHVLMALKFSKRLRLDGNSLFQQIQDHFTDRVDLVGVGMFQHLLTFETIGFLENAGQERALSP